ncbi:arginine deiminase family protein [Bradyrhizobium sp. 61]|uniref:arginine deiminase family protein n=1 Tax=Bradyrhizobium sp. 61 TaxID=2782679 RepID=UPI001FF964E7|nr:arginine deiminase family protein [Bradyrhizobium sp. 61]
MKSVYTRESVIAVGGGAIVTRLGPPIRRGEELPVTRTLANLGMPILRTISDVGLMEGGSFAFITPKLAVVGLSSRVDEEGARQLEDVLRTQGVELLRVHLTGYRLHIDGMFVMIDRDTAFVNPTLLVLVPRKAQGIEDPPDRGLPRRPELGDQLPCGSSRARDRAGRNFAADHGEIRQGRRDHPRRRLRQGRTRRRRHPLLHPAVDPRPALTTGREPTSRFPCGRTATSVRPIRRKPIRFHDRALQGRPEPEKMAERPPAAPIPGD